jgi:hypothetical protein
MEISRLKEYYKLLKTLYENKQYKEYVVLFLILKYEFDELQCKVYPVGVERDKTKNHMVFNSKFIVWYRLNKSSPYLYDLKLTRIKDQKLLECVKHLDCVFTDDEDIPAYVSNLTNGLTQEKIRAMKY